MKSLKSLKSEVELKNFLEEYNWDDGFTIPAKILENEYCTLQIALRVFWLADGYSYLLERENASNDTKWITFMNNLYNNILEGRYYSGWFNSLYEIESFDSYSGEYELARLLDTSPHIKWWHRLHSYYQAYIYYTAKDRYFPDFVAFDDEGTYWIIEGKSESGRRRGA